MSKRIVRNGDKAKGKISGKNHRVYAVGKVIAIKGNRVAAHFPCGMPSGSAHCAAKISDGSSTVKCGGKGVVRNNDGATCNHKARAGQQTVYAA